MKIFLDRQRQFQPQAPMGFKGRSPLMAPPFFSALLRKKGFLLGLLFCVGLFLAGCQSEKFIPPEPRYHMVAERLTRDESGRYHFYVDRIDLRTNDIVHTTEVPEQPFYLLEIPDGRVVFSFCRAPGAFQQKLGEITSKGSYKEFMKTAYDSPTPVTVYDNKVFIVEGIHHSREMGLEVADLTGKSLGYTRLFESAMISPEEWLILPDTREWLFFPKVYYNSASSPDGLNRVLESLSFDLKKQTITTQNLAYAWTPSLNPIKAQTGWFVAPGVDYRIPQSSPDYVIKRIDKVTYPDWNLEKSFPMKDQVHEMAYDPDTHKLYARMRDGAGIAVIDTATDTHLYDLPYHAQAMAYVGEKRLAVSVAHWEMDTKGTPYLVAAKLVLINTETDAVVREFEGHYDHIGRDVGLQWRE